MLHVVFIHLVLLYACPVNAVRRTSLRDIRGDAGNRHDILVFLNGQTPLYQGTRNRDTQQQYHVATTPKITHSGNYVRHATAKWHEELTIMKQCGRTYNAVHAVGRDSHPPLTQVPNNTQPMMIKTSTLNIQFLHDWIKRKKELIRNAITALEYPITKPGSYLAKICRHSMINAEQCVRLLAKQIHTWYIEACNLEINNIFSIGSDPLFNIIRLIGVTYAIDWWTGASLIKARFELNPQDVFVKGQYYRLVTSLFLHNGLVHLLQNVRSLWGIGSEATALLGPTRTLIVYFASGILANYISYVYNFAYKNGIPAHLFNVTQATVHGIGQTSSSTASIVEKVIDRIRSRQHYTAFPVFLIWYANDTMFHIIDNTVRTMMPFFQKQRQHPNNPDVNTAIQGYIKRKVARQKSCGASAAIYGLMGAVCAYYIRFGDKEEKRRIVEIVTTSMAQNLVALWGANVDHVSHLIGFLTGLGLTFTF
ncbi:uncharacterized protein BXIN_0673 [Babesia sp. Xinjiang]|uniref:uncharacterized protein n=1 Tax=Babesia sp. Xinjiang TaxID=462227 RepID=UPI000A26103A|nr:uncharacterized protein BXIN_0726 [Babesia sp. Xinjiang]XP_028872589.1 uncharacterized protein BXIN_0673 [Babesia sp. Xinjiang]ORM42094.1 hypothetical protein BXIN_0726 [Babesia sp. Xinjiang]ORM42133.1 hypothetical protein BXIN_0673 [Babesia sp. Xinjiang]